MSEKHHSSGDIKAKDDVETCVVSVEATNKPRDDMLRDPGDATATVRGLKGRHLQLIGIGAAIGTGLFIGSSRSLIYGGPLGATLAYTIYCLVVWGICLGTCEIASFLPVRGGFITWARMYVDDAASTAIGWNYFYATTMYCCADIIAVGGMMAYWLPHVNVAVWISASLVIITALNVYHVRFFGESEFYLASLKVILILMIIVMTFVSMLGGNPKHDRVGFRYWANPGLFAEYQATGTWGRFLGFWRVFKIAAFSIGGPEIVAMSAAEAVHPRKTLPRATKGVVFRLAVFFVLGSICMGILVPYNDPELLQAVNTGVGSDAAAFVVGMKRVGIKVMPHIFNAIVMTSALSCANGLAFISTRSLHALACQGKAPAIFARTTKHGIPLYAYCVVFLVMCLSYLQVSNNAATVFGWFINLSSAGELVTLGSLAVIILRFRAGLKKQGYNPHEFLPWSTRWTVPYARVSLGFLTVITLTQGWTVFVKGGWDVQEFFTSYFGLFFVFTVFAAWKLTKRTTWIRPENMDFESMVPQFDALEQYYTDNPVRSATWFGRALDKLF